MPSPKICTEFQGTVLMAIRITDDLQSRAWKPISANENEFKGIRLLVETLPSA